MYHVKSFLLCSDIYSFDTEQCLICASQRNLVYFQPKTFMKIKSWSVRDQWKRLAFCFNLKIWVICTMLLKFKIADQDFLFWVPIVLARFYRNTVDFKNVCEKTLYFIYQLESLRFIFFFCKQWSIDIRFFFGYIAIFATGKVVHLNKSSVTFTFKL